MRPISTLPPALVVRASASRRRVHQSRPFRQAATEPKLLSARPTQASRDLVALSALRIVHRPILPPGAEDVQSERVVLCAGLLECCVDLADRFAEASERILKPITPHMFM